MKDELDELLTPVIDALKRRAECAIEDARRRVENVLRVTYATEGNMAPEDCPAPRLQFRWIETADGYVCHYEFVFPLGERDIRCTDFNGSRFAVIELGRTTTSGMRNFKDGLRFETPYRDGAHATWDGPNFGNPPTFIVAPDGSFAERESRSLRP
jgi:hypothetical protein